MLRVSSLVLLAVLASAAPARAQDQWGVSVGLTPSWQTGAPVRLLFRADQIDMHGSEVRFGFVRGELTSGDWGLSFVDKSIKENSTLETNAAFYRTLAQDRLTGIEFHQFQPFKTWRERIQLGMLGGVGVGWLRGQVYKRTTDIESFSTPADELFPPSSSVVPLMKLEIAGTAIVAPGLKVRVSGGFSMPGYHTFGITMFYLVPQR